MHKVNAFTAKNVWSHDFCEVCKKSSLSALPLRQKSRTPAWVKTGWNEAMMGKEMRNEWDCFLRKWTRVYAAEHGVQHNIDTTWTSRRFMTVTREFFKELLLFCRKLHDTCNTFHIFREGKNKHKPIVSIRCYKIFHLWVAWNKCHIL